MRKQNIYHPRFEVLTAIIKKNSIFWDKMLCSLLKVIQHFRVTCHLHLQHKKISQARSQHEAGSKQSELHTENQSNIGRKGITRELMVT
jgi:hypothetical protein